MARPKKADHEKRTERFNLRLTMAEVAHLSAQAEAAGLTMNEYARRRVVGHVVRPAPQRADANLISEINRIGVNLNQLTRSHHTDRYTPHDWRILYEELQRVLGKVLARYDT